MSTALDIDTDVDVNMDIEPNCEYEGHTDPDYSFIHDEGPARWRIRQACPSCTDTDVLLACDKRAQHAQSNSRMWCSACGDDLTAKDFLISIHRI